MSDYFPIIIPSKILMLEDLEVFKDNPFPDFVKFTVDIEKELIAIGGEMHSDSESVLFSSGSRQDDIWGANLFPWQEKAAIEYISLINISPSRGNKKMEIENKDLQERVFNIVKKWIQLSYE